MRESSVIKPDLRWVARTTLLVAFTVPCLIAVGFAGGCSAHDWYARRMPPRSYVGAPFAEVIRNLEDCGVLPLGTSWQSEPLKRRRVSYGSISFPTDREVIWQLAMEAGVVVGYRMDTHGSIRSSLHIRDAAGAKPGVEYREGGVSSEPRYALEGYGVPLPGR